MHGPGAEVRCKYPEGWEMVLLDPKERNRKKTWPVVQSNYLRWSSGWLTGRPDRGERAAASKEGGGEEEVVSW
jgi:hypothetical protein